MRELQDSDFTPEELEDVELYAWMLRERGLSYALDVMFKEALRSFFDFSAGPA